TVTGVQTCALPISPSSGGTNPQPPRCQYFAPISTVLGLNGRRAIVRVHGSRVTAVQMRARCGRIKADLATFGPEATPENASACRTEARNAAVGSSPAGEPNRTGTPARLGDSR